MEATKLIREAVELEKRAYRLRERASAFTGAVRSVPYGGIVADRRDDAPNEGK